MNQKLKLSSDRLGRLGANLASLNAKGYGVPAAVGIPPGVVKDPNSAWSVNSTTGLYYDVNSKSYLHSATGKYYYLDVATNSLKEWASATAAAAASAAVAEADKFLQVSMHLLSSPASLTFCARKLAKSQFLPPIQPRALMLQAQARGP